MMNTISRSLGSSPLHPYLHESRSDFGPKELAEVVAHTLRMMDTEVISDHVWMPESGLKSLIEVTYFTSLEPEEGRYPCCTVFWGNGSHQWFDLVDFKAYEALSVQLLHKLAPICQTRDTAIRVAIIDGSLKVIGLTAINFEGLNAEPGTAAFIQSGREQHIKVHILAPGHIRVDCGWTEIELRAGRIRQCSSLFSLESIKIITSEFSKSVQKDVISKLNLGVDAERNYPALLESARADQLLEIILRPILDAGHGGTILVIPDRNAVWIKQSIELKEVSDLNLKERWGEFVATCIEFNKDPSNGPRKWLQRRGRILIACKAISDLAAVDGCVVLTRSLSVVGFAAKINVSREAAIASRRNYINAKNSEVRPLEELEKLGGTRLRSALWLCKCFPNVIAFVVSQDKQLKTLWSDEDFAYAFGPLVFSTHSH